MNTQEKMEHSKEPWQSECQFVCSNSKLIATSNHRNDTIANANAARIVACVNFCAGIHIETLTLLNQADHPTLTQICEENQSLRKQLAEAKIQTKIAADLGDKCEQLEKMLEDSRAELAKEKQRILFDQDAADKLSRCGALVDLFTNYVYKLTGNEGEDDILTVLESYVSDLKAELAKHVCPTCKKSGDNSICSDSWHLELAKNKAAREFINLHGNEVANYVDRSFEAHQDYRDRLAAKLRAIIQPKEKK